MELILLDKSFRNIAVIDRVTEFSVKKRFFMPGEFKLTVPYDVKIPDGARYIYDGNSDCYGVIEGISRKNSRRISLTGRTLEALLDRRVIYGGGRYTGNVESSVRMVVDINAVKSRNIAGLTLGEVCGIEGESVLNADWDVLSEWIYNALRPYGASYTISFNDSRNVLEFKVVKGTDRTRNQSKNPCVVFSEEIGSIENTDCELSSDGYCNTAYVVGADMTCVVVSEASSDADSIELHVSAGDIYPEHYSSTEAYKAALARRGEEKLKLHGGVVRLKGNALSGEFIYGEHYSLGDICEISFGDGTSYSVRVTAVTYVYEGGSVTVTPSFGDEEKTLRDIVRDEAEKILGRA